MAIKGRKKVFGEGINDSQDNVCGEDGKINPSYRCWYNMLARCYNEKTKRNFPHCVGCSVCDEWKSYLNFKSWFNKHYVEGWELDKDILVKGNKVYSPQTCCFVPREINSLFTKHSRGRGEYPIGVFYDTRGWQKKFVAALRVDGKRYRIGSFITPLEAFVAYKNFKEAHILEVAERWKHELDHKVYEAMCNYVVEVTD
jgi:hypothetical protein